MENPEGLADARGEASTRILVDADACPVKEEVYRVAARRRIPVLLVANSRMGIPEDLEIQMIVVGRDLDAADDWIAEHVKPCDVVITADIPLAARCLKQGARVLGNNGRPFTEESIGSALATRDLKAQLREMGVESSGPKEFSPKDRSRFLSRLDQLVGEAQRVSRA
ncbi:MAG: YaiI/YqxD family protein [bacterium]|nr:YaiI/YqxD family protein [bacterium]